MKGIRLKVKIIFEYPYFFPHKYKEEISLSLKNIGFGRFCFSDLICKKKQNLEDGFYAFEEARFDITTIYDRDIFAKIKLLTEQGIKIGGLRINNIKVEINQINFFSEGYLLSPAIVLDEMGNSIYFLEQPVKYSQTVKNILMNKHFDLFGKYPNDNNFVILFRKLPLKIVCQDKIMVKSKFEMYGSEELIYLANVLGLGNNNEEGYGMISEYLYFYKSR